MKSLLNKAGDKLGVTDRSKAPVDADFNALVGDLGGITKGLKDLETRLVLLNSSCVKTLGDAEKLAVHGAALFGPMGVGRNGDFARVKEAKTEHDARYVRVQEVLRGLNAELKRLQALVDDRHRLGAEATKAKKREREGQAAEGEESDVGRTEQAYEAAHEKALAELLVWKNNLAVSFSPLYDLVLELELAFVSRPPVASSFSAAASWTIPIPKLW